MQLFFSRSVMGRTGRDPQFLKQVEISVPEYIRRQAEAHLKSADAATNFLLRFIFTGSFGDPLPPYLRAENFEAIRAGLDRLSLKQAAAEEIVQAGGHDVYCLSNIFEYYPQADFTGTVDRWSAALPAGARLLFWNLMAPRSFSAIKPDTFRCINSQDSPKDAGFFYSAFLHEQKI
jgi:S-adenosylmethionine-diacylglycerol 3-amino-3-carboxypropyl transferase